MKEEGIVIVENASKDKENFVEIDKSLIGAFQAWSEDIDRDGDIDLFYPTYSKSRLGTPKWSYFWWENTKSGFKINKKFRFKAHF